MSDLEFRITGLEDLAKTYDAIGVSMRDELAASLMVEGEAIMTDSKSSYVPVDQGILRDSGTVLPPTWADRVVSVILGFGGAAAAYALAIHEHLSAHSPRSWKIAEAAGHAVQFKVGGPKYLEIPFLARTGGMIDRIRERLQRRLEAYAK